MIYVLCSGGLGNQMFQYALYRSLIFAGKQAVFDTSYYKHETVHSGYEIEKCFGIKVGEDKNDHFNVVWKFFYSLMARTKKYSFHNIIMENPQKILDINFVQNKAVLFGYWQSENYFKTLKNELISELKFQNISEKSQIMARKMRKENSIAIHVRRGDYLKTTQYMNLSETNYYNRAIDYINEHITNPQYYVFSDEIDWCKKNMKLPQDKTTYVDFNTGTRSYEDMYLISCSKNAILANSSFSWWAGYLGKHDIVIRPSKYKVNWSKEQDDMLYPVEWIKIEV